MIRKLVLTAVILAGAAAIAQTDNTVYVKQFAGRNLGTKLTNAIAGCPSTTITCNVIVDASLADWATGTIPAIPANVVLQDMRYQGKAFTVATLPSNPLPGLRVSVTDANTDCATGGGTSLVDCRWSGSAWQTIGGGGGGGGGGASPFPSNMQLMVIGASQDIGYNTQQEGNIVTPPTLGTGYSGTGTASVPTLTCAATLAPRQPVIQAIVDPGGSTGVVPSVTDFGQGCTPGTYPIVLAGFTGGSGFAATFTVYPTPNYTDPWPSILITLSALNGKVSSFLNYSVTAHTVAQAIADIPGNGYLTKCADPSHREYAIVGGDLIRNSIAVLNGNIPLNTAYSQWIGFAHALKTAGCTVIVTTPWDDLQYSGGGGNGGATNAQAAQDIRRGVRGIDYDYIIDFNAMMLNVTDQQCLSWDQLHQTRSCHNFFAYNGNHALLTNGTGTISNLMGQFVGTILKVNTATVGTLLANQYQGLNPTTPGFLAGWLAGSNEAELYSVSTTGTAGSLKITGLTSSGTPTTLFQFTPTLNTTSIASTFTNVVTIGQGLHLNGASGLVSNVAGIGYTAANPGITQFDCASNGGTTGTCKFNGDNSTPVGNTYLTLSSTAYTFGLTSPVVASIFSPTATQSTVSCSTSGNVIFAQPLQGSSFAAATVYMNNCNGTAAYVFPHALTHTPDCLSTNLVCGTVATAISNTGITMTGTGTTGFAHFFGW